MEFEYQMADYEGHNQHPDHTKFVTSTYWAKYVDKFLENWNYEADLVRKKTKPMVGFVGVGLWT